MTQWFVSFLNNPGKVHKEFSELQITYAENSILIFLVPGYEISFVFVDQWLQYPIKKLPCFQRRWQ